MKHVYIILKRGIICVSICGQVILPTALEGGLRKGSREIFLKYDVCCYIIIMSIYYLLAALRLQQLGSRSLGCSSYYCGNNIVVYCPCHTCNINGTFSVLTRRAYTTDGIDGSWLLWYIYGWQYHYYYDYHAYYYHSYIIASQEYKESLSHQL